MCDFAVWDSIAYSFSGKKKEPATACLRLQTLFSDIGFFLGPGVDVGLECRDFLFLQFICDTHINIKSCGHIRMSENRLDHLDVQTALTHSCRECMSEDMTAEIR